MKIALLTFFWLLPGISHAAIIISEVAWMGSTASANHEWIELQNTGSASVEVTGWTISDGMNLTIQLTGTIPGSGYAVVERTSDASAPGTALLFYSGALVNTGATLTLKRADSSIEDQVAGGENWQSIGGDNVTKETAQYTTTGWVTGAATAGIKNSGVVKIVPDKDIKNATTTTSTSTTINTTNTSKRTSSSNSKETVRLILPGVTLALDIDGQTVGYVNQAISFSVSASGIGKTLAESLLYQWNFGDGNTALEDKPVHAFSYPGKYVVTVYGSYMRQEQVARHEITILPVALSVTKSSTGDVQINNDSPYELDISGYQLEGNKLFTFPAYSVLLPNQTVTISQNRLGGSYARVKDTTGAVVSTRISALESHKKNELRTTESKTAIAAPVRSDSTISIKTESATNTKNYVLLANTTSEIQSIAVAKNSPYVAAVASSTSGVPSEAWPYLGLIGVIILGLIGTARKVVRN